ncbi:hypothetical protein [Nostoc sp. CCY0012]
MAHLSFICRAIAPTHFITQRTWAKIHLGADYLPTRHFLIHMNQH